MRQAYGLMVNYLYKLDDIEANHEAFVGRGEVVTTQSIRRLVPSGRGTRTPVPLREPLSEAQPGDAHDKKAFMEPSQ